MEIESHYYAILVSFMKITSFVAVAYVISFIQNTKTATTHIGYFRGYFLVVLFAAVLQSLAEVLQFPVRLDIFVFMYVTAIVVLLMALDERARSKLSVKIAILILLLLCSSSLFSNYSDYSCLMTQTLFGILFYAFLSYIVIKKGRALDNIGYLIMSSAFLIQVFISLVELYFMLNNNLTTSYSLAMFSTNAGIMLVIIGFLTINLIDEHKYLNTLALTDTLTGMNNRRGLQFMIQTVVPSYNRTNTCFSVITMDIDFFKKVNDTYGHDAGDIVLKQFSNLIKNSHRNSDISCRLGGEEFLLVLQDTNKEDAILIAEKLRKATQELEMSVKSVFFNITASFGVSTSCDEFINMDDLVKNADKALYIAKYNGRNQVIHIDNNCVIK